jgi:bacterioferritin-associated ferredoxin
LGSQRSLARTAAATATKALVAKAHQGHGAQMIALQASHGIANDCGHCALKNVTVNDSFTLDETIGVARGLEEKLSDKAVRLGAAQKVHHLDADILWTRTRDGHRH